MMDARTDQEETRHEAIERVEQEARDRAEAPAPERPSKLPLSKVEMEPKVFQQRTSEGPMFGKSMGHTDRLAEAIRNSPTHELEPIDIWWSGRRWIVVDGHHRLKAYRKVATDPKRPLKGVRVPVRVFEGTFDEALGRSGEGNVKDKLVMSEEEKSDLAWRFTCRGEQAKPRWTKAQVAKLSGRSKETVAIMRKTRKSLIEKIEAEQIGEVTVAGLAVSISE